MGRGALGLFSTGARLSIARQIDGVQHLQRHLAAWLYTVCRNRALDVGKKEWRMQALDQETVEARVAQGPGPDVRAEVREECALGLEAISALPGPQQEAFRLKFEHGLTYRLLSDPVNEVARAYGVAFELPPGLRSFHRTLGLDLEQFNGDDSWVLPIPATFVVGADGKVHYSATSPDPTQRPDPQLAIQALRELRS